MVFNYKKLIIVSIIKAIELNGKSDIMVLR